jgi:hypothetical protein
MPSRDQLAGKIKRAATSIVNFGWQISIIKAMFTNNTATFIKVDSCLYIMPNVCVKLLLSQERA